ncbi:MAG: peptidase dipeptidylpeptidase domain protein [Acidobacteria bacterium]|nr:peptidase dipeptidylpeptidase domain protein [Acidobacteriota bacterium]
MMMSAFAIDLEAQYFGRNKVQYRTFQFKVLKTAHFDIYYYDEAAGVSAIVGRMAERWYSRLSGILNHDLQFRQPLILYASHPHFEQTNAIPDEIGEGTGGVTEALKRRVVLPLAGPLGETDHVLGHEIVHAFQFDITAQGPSEAGYEIPGALRLPLWFIEGMAEYLTLGPIDAHTAMWMRDAAIRESLPSIRRLDNPRYFPYRYGHAFWAYVAGEWGDAATGRMLMAAGRSGDPEDAIQAVLGITSDDLSGKWREAVTAAYLPIVKSRGTPQEIARPILTGRQGERPLNIAPSISPDGTQLVFLSAKDLFSVEVYLADVGTGKIRRKLTETATDPHLESIQLVNSAGDWSPDGKKFVLAAISKGKAVLRILDMADGGVIEQIRITEADEILNPTWSPDGREIAFSAMHGGVLDLFVLDLQRRAVRSLTNDVYADVHPAWAPDGRVIAFATDRFTSSVDDLLFGEYRLALYDAASGRIDAVAATDKGNQINPQWNDDGTNLYFISDQQGVPDLYRLELPGNRVFQVSRLRTGVSGLTRLSPAISTAGGAGTIAFCTFQNDGYELYILNPTQRPEVESMVTSPLPVYPAVLPPQARKSATVSQYLKRSPPGLTRGESFTREKYKARFSLDAVSQPTITGGISSYGTYIGGGSTLYWSDMLGDHNLATGFQINTDGSNIVNNLSALAGYENRKRRWNWGVVGGQVPLLSAGLSQRLDQIEGEPAYVEELTRYWQINREVSGTLSYPLNRSQRIVFSGGYQSVAFAAERQTRAVSLATGTILTDQVEDLPTAPSINLSKLGAALVYDQAILGGTGPILGQRYRFDASHAGGDLSFTTALADYRRYVMPFRPITLAGRVLHLGRYGPGAEDPRLSQLFLGYSSLVRGYTSGSYAFGECLPLYPYPGTCQGSEQLFGSKIAVVNAELRIPLLGALGIVRSAGFLPVDAAFFYDGGVAWNHGEKPAILGGSRRGISSHGVSIRLNFLGILVGQFSIVHPNDRPDRGWHMEFSFNPGF